MYGHYQLTVNSATVQKGLSCLRSQLVSSIIISQSVYRLVSPSLSMHLLLYISILHSLSQWSVRAWLMAAWCRINISFTQYQQHRRSYKWHAGAIDIAPFHYQLHTHFDHVTPKLKLPQCWRAIVTSSIRFLKSHGVSEREHELIIVSVSCWWLMVALYWPIYKRYRSLLVNYCIMISAAAGPSVKCGGGAFGPYLDLGLILHLAFGTDLSLVTWQLRIDCTMAAGFRLGIPHS